MCVLETLPTVAQTGRLLLRGGLLANDAAGFVIEHRDLGVIGKLGFREAEVRRPRMAVRVDPTLYSPELATEAVTAALDWARTDWGRSAVWAAHAPDDLAASRVLIDAGFLYTGDREPDGRMMVWLA